MYTTWITNIPSVVCTYCSPRNFISWRTMRKWVDSLGPLNHSTHIVQIEPVGLPNASNTIAAHMGHLNKQYTCESHVHEKEC